MKSFLSGAKIIKARFLAKSPLSTVLILQTVKKTIFLIAFCVSNCNVKIKFFGQIKVFVCVTFHRNSDSQAQNID